MPVDLFKENERLRLVVRRLVDGEPGTLNATETPMSEQAERDILDRLAAGEYLIQFYGGYLYSDGGEDPPTSSVRALCDRGHLVAVRNTLVLSSVARMELAGVDLGVTAEALETP